MRRWMTHRYTLVAGAVMLVVALVAGTAPFAAAAGGSREAEPAEEIGEAAAEEGSIDDARRELLERWDALVQRRGELKRELAEVRRELRQLARELWPRQGEGRDLWFGERDWDDAVPRWTEEDWEKLREELREYGEQVRQRIEALLSARGQELLPWIPEAVIERVAARTGRTPDEVRELIAGGAWDELWRVKEPEEESAA